MRVVDVNTVELTFQYQEPTMSADGTPLQDLAYTTVYYQIDNQAPQSVPQLVSTKPSGGGTISGSMLVHAPTGSKSSVQVWATATDNTGNVSQKSDIVSVSIDRIPPAPPSGFSVA